MKIDDIPPFSRGYASKLLKRADAELFGSHVRPSKIESAAGRLAATLGTTKPAEAQNKHAEAKRRRSKQNDPRQMKFRL